MSVVVEVVSDNQVGINAWEKALAAPVPMARTVVVGLIGWRYGSVWDPLAAECQDDQGNAYALHSYRGTNNPGIATWFCRDVVNGPQTFTVTPATFGGSAGNGLGFVMVLEAAPVRGVVGIDVNDANVGDAGPMQAGAVRAPERGVVIVGATPTNDDYSAAAEPDGWTLIVKNAASGANGQDGIWCYREFSGPVEWVNPIVSVTHVATPRSTDLVIGAIHAGAQHSADGLSAPRGTGWFPRGGGMF